MLFAAYAMLYLLVFLFGACAASFINVLVYRLPRGISPAKGRSFCPRCRHSLTANDLVPILSFVLLGGRCRYCRGRIAARYALVETMGGLISVLCYALYGLPLHLFYFLTACVLLFVALIDYDTKEIPDASHIALCICAVLALFIEQGTGWGSRVIGFFALSVPMLLLSLLLPGAFGGGDIKLMAVSGFLLGWQGILLAMFLALITGGSAGVFLLLRKKANRKTQIAFGPYLCIGVFGSLLFGEGVVSWYTSLLFP